jgi:hypothetical protein
MRNIRNKSSFCFCVIDFVKLTSTNNGKNTSFFIIRSESKGSASAHSKKFRMRQLYVKAFDFFVLYDFKSPITGKNVFKNLSKTAHFHFDLMEFLIVTVLRRRLPCLKRFVVGICPEILVTNRPCSTNVLVGLK